MTPRPPGSCFHAVSSFHSGQHAVWRVAPARFARQYAQPHQSQPQPHSRRQEPTAQNATNEQFSAKAALAAIESKVRLDPANPPRSTLPPPLAFPERASTQSALIYWLHIGKAYGSFYKEGIKAVWFNHHAASLLRKRIQKDLGAKNGVDAARRSLISRSEWQILKRNEHDIGKLPFFALLVLLFGEWLPVMVPFLPDLVPGTCRIPKQVRGMREQAEARRRISFRLGTTEPSMDQFSDDELVVGERRSREPANWPMTGKDYVKNMVKSLNGPQLHHLSSTLGLHGRLWDRIQLPPPAILLRHRLTNYLHSLSVDDKLLHSAGSSQLLPAELENACGDRGLDILGRNHTVLRNNLQLWLKLQEGDHGRGRAMLLMLFRRPNAWDSIPAKR